MSGVFFMNKENVLQVIKSALAGAVVSVFFVLGLAFFVRIRPLSSAVQLAVAQTLKSLSLLIGCLLFLRGEGGWRKGLLAGVLFTVLTYLLFSSVGGFAWSWNVVIDLVLGLGVGLFSGIVAVNLTHSA
jgi:putative membrane protein (TIGR04086 family)